MFVLQRMRENWVMGYEEHSLEGVPFRAVVAHLDNMNALALAGASNVIIAFNPPRALVHNPRHRVVLQEEHMPLLREACGGLGAHTLDIVADEAPVYEGYQPDWGVYVPTGLVGDTEAARCTPGPIITEDGLVFVAAYNEQHNILSVVDYVHDVPSDQVAPRTEALIRLLREVGVPIPEHPVSPPNGIVRFPDEPITLGADPEFELIRGGRIVSASSIVRERELPWGNIGVDGAGDQVELRPNPGTPEELVANVGRLLLSMPHIAGGYPSTMCEVWSTGGHIHIGFQRVSLIMEYAQSIVEAIDKSLGGIFFGLNTKTRIKSGYGRRGEWRAQSWGIEYRTPPASVWSHPQVALAFLRAIEHIVRKLLHEGVWDPANDPEWPGLYRQAEMAAHLVLKYQGRLHWGAWKAWLGDFNLAREANVQVSFTSTAERDPAFLDDMRLLLVRVGLPSVSILPLRADRGERISNVPGYGELWNGGAPFSPGNPTLALSWRFRNDPAFRQEEMPKLERAILDVLSANSNDDAGRLIKEPVQLEGEWPDAPTPPPIPVDEGDDEDDETIRCQSCGGRFDEDDIIYNCYDTPFCNDCYWHRYARCDVCDTEIYREDALYDDSGVAYCEECYADRFTRCDLCEEDYPNDEVSEVEVVSPEGRTRISVCTGCFDDRLVYDEERDVYIAVA